MESVNKKVILIAIILALFTTFLVYIYIQKSTVKPEVVEYINVYVAAKTLPAKHKITNQDIKQAKVTREYLNSRAILNKSDIVGKRLKDSVIEGEQILSERLVEEGKGTLSFSIPEGMRAVSINVNEQIAVSNLLRPGDFVDVVASFEREEVESAVAKTVFPRITKIIVQNVQILAISQDQLITEEKLKEAPKTLTLAVKVQDVEKLVYASEYAVLRLVLRPVEDEKNVNTPGTIREDMVPAKGVFTVPVKQ